MLRWRRDARWVSAGPHSGTLGVDLAVSALQGGHESCRRRRDGGQLTGAGHRGSVAVGSEKASVTGARRGSFPDRVAVGRALGTAGICGEGLVISNFAG